MNRRLPHIIACLAISVLLPGCDKDAEIGPKSPVTESTNSAPAPIVDPEVAKLLGKWHRIDGDYLLQIKHAEPGGKLDVGYFNPSPINVSRAIMLKKEGATKVFVELRDVNYPGSTYTLAYDPKTDQLFGQYFQAAMQQTFDVVFTRADAQ